MRDWFNQKRNGQNKMNFFILHLLLANDHLNVSNFFKIVMMGPLFPLGLCKCLKGEIFKTVNRFISDIGTNYAS